MGDGGMQQSLFGCCMNGKEATKATAALFREYGGTGQVISLPDDMGIYGNTHLMMQDDNSTFVAEMITSWLLHNIDTQPIRRRSQ